MRSSSTTISKGTKGEKRNAAAMDLDDARPPSPPAPSFVKRSKLRGARSAANSGTATAIGSPASDAAAAAGSAATGNRDAGRPIKSALGVEGGDDDDDDAGSSVVVRSNGFNSAAKRNRLKGTQSVMTSSSQKPAVSAPSSSRGFDSTGFTSSAPSSSVSEVSLRPAFPVEASRLSTADIMRADGGGEPDEDFIPIRTRRAPVGPSPLERQALDDTGPLNFDEDVIIPVYENQEVLPDPGPIESLDFLDGGGQQQQTHASAQPTRLDEPAVRSNPLLEKRVAMKQEGVIPSLNSASLRIGALLEKADSAVAAYETVIVDAKKNLDVLVDEEKENKTTVEGAGEKEAWFRELEEFIGTVARFLDAKMPLLEAVERDNIALSAQRSRIIQRTRAKDAEDELALFYGVPAISLLPPRNEDISQPGGEPTSSFQDEMVDSLPSEDGPALGPIREARRVQAAQRPAEQEDELSPLERIALQNARGEVYTQLASVTSDVLAPEFLDPAATVISTLGREQDQDVVMTNGSSVEVERKLHPASLVSRFSTWRSKFPDEYQGSWGGLALAGAWEFWCRREMADVDLLRPARKYSTSLGGLADAGANGEGGGLELGQFAWYQRLSEFIAGSKVGGDDEAIEAMIGNVVVPRLVALAESGGFDPWSGKDGSSIVHLTRQIHAVVDPKAWRFQSLLAAYLAVFRTHITTFLKASVELRPVLPPAGFHPGIPAARLSFLRRLVRLFRNLVAWHPFVGEAEREAFLMLVDDFVGRGVWPHLVATKDFGSVEIARELLAMAPNGLFMAELLSRLSSFAAMAR
ncbi:hypothetical protein CF319_g1367 [Tilletia indica]|nr:hypothetical protein CF319_g1367 [Tilletia indica]